MEIYNIIDNKNEQFKDYVRLIQEHVKARILTDEEFKTLNSTGNLRLQINNNINIQVSGQPNNYIGAKPYIVISHEFQRAYIIDKEEFEQIFKSINDTVS